MRQAALNAGEFATTGRNAPPALTDLRQFGPCRTRSRRPGTCYLPTTIAMLSAAYVIQSGIVVALGIAIIAWDFPDGALVGFPAALIGLIHVLNWRHGAGAPGIRWTARVIGPPFIAALVGLGAGFDWPPLAIATVVGLVGVSALAVFPAALAGRAWLPRPSGREPASPGLSGTYLAGIAVVAGFGTYTVADDLLHPGMFFGVGLVAGYAFLLVALANALNWRYGLGLPHMISTVAGANLVLMLLLWASRSTASGNSLAEQVVLVAAPILITVLSMTTPALAGSGETRNVTSS